MALALYEISSRFKNNLPTIEEMSKKLKRMNIGANECKLQDKKFEFNT